MSLLVAAVNQSSFTEDGPSQEASHKDAINHAASAAKLGILSQLSIRPSQLALADSDTDSDINWFNVRFELNGYWRKNRRRAELLRALPFSHIPGIVFEDRPATDWPLVAKKIALHIVSCEDREKIMKSLPPMVGEDWRIVWDPKIPGDIFTDTKIHINQD